MDSSSFPLLATQNDCTGCAACQNICAHDAISMPWNSEGFRQPLVNLERCVHCGACSKVCPALNPLPKAGTDHPQFYSGWILDEQKRQKSSSGGIFTALAENILDAGGDVYGASLREDMTVAHCRVTSKEELNKLRGSKYVQSEIGSTYRDVRESLKSGKRVLFVGTPCQVGGLRNYLRKDHELLLTCDLACHGVPSFNLYSHYLNYCAQQQGAAVSHISFRDKVDEGWLDYYVKRTFTDSAVSSTIHRDDLFMRGFLSDLALGQACYHCQFTGFPRMADITLADFWGVDEIHRNWNIANGVSLACVHSDKGGKALELIQDKCFLTQETEEDALLRNPSILKSWSRPKRRERFLSDLEQSSFSDAIEKHTEKCRAKTDIALVGMWMSCNYGAVLTTYALYRLLESMGNDVTLLDYSPMLMVPRWVDPESVYRHFLRRADIKISEPLYSYDNLRSWNSKVDTFLLGSDQVWRYEYIKYFGHLYFLDFVEGNKKKIAFGSSFGTDIDWSPETFRTKSSLLLEGFDALSVREEEGVRILKEQYNLEAQLVLDPVFLVPTSYYDQIIEKSNRDTSAPYVLSYILDPTSSKRNVICQVKNSLGGVKLVNMVDAQFNFAEKKAALNLPGTVDDLTVEDWLAYMKSCEFLVTDSFHGMCFAIIFRKPFICITNPQRGLSRFKSLAKALGVESRIFSEATDSYLPDQMPPLDWEGISKTLTQLEITSRKWLQDALRKERPSSKSRQATIVDQLFEKQHKIDELSKITENQSKKIDAQNKTFTEMLSACNMILLNEQLKFDKLVLSLNAPFHKYYEKKLRHYRLMKHLSFGKRRKRYKEKIRQLREILSYFEQALNR